MRGSLFPRAALLLCVAFMVQHGVLAASHASIYAVTQNRADCKIMGMIFDVLPEIKKLVEDPTTIATFFMPRDQAFEALLTELGVSVGDLLKDTEALADWVKYHVVPAGAYKTSDFGMGRSEVNTALGKDYTIFVNKLSKDDIRVEGDINTAKVKKADIEAGAAVVYIIGQVLKSPPMQESSPSPESPSSPEGSPSSPEESFLSPEASSSSSPEESSLSPEELPSSPEESSSSPEEPPSGSPEVNKGPFSTLREAIGALPEISLFGELVKAFDNGLLDATVAEMTTFAPNNAAMRSALEKYMLDLGATSGPQKERLKALWGFILSTHVLLDDVLPSSKLKDGMELPFGADEPISVMADGDGEDIFINGFNTAQVVEKDIKAAGGYIHVVDSLILTANMDAVLKLPWDSSGTTTPDVPSMPSVPSVPSSPSSPSGGDDYSGLGAYFDAHPDYSLFKTVIIAAGLDTWFQFGPSMAFTLWVPSNDAIEKFLEANHLKEEDLKDLTLATAISGSHQSMFALTSEDVKPGQPVPILLATNAVADVDGGIAYIEVSASFPPISTRAMVTFDNHPIKQANVQDPLYVHELDHVLVTDVVASAAATLRSGR